MSYVLEINSMFMLSLRTPGRHRHSELQADIVTPHNRTYHSFDRTKITLDFGTLNVIVFVLWKLETRHSNYPPRCRHVTSGMLRYHGYSVCTAI
jgi:hypothetical protein